MDFNYLKSEADNLVNEKNYSAAIIVYQTIIMNEDFANEEKIKNVFFNKGYCLFSNKEFIEAIESFEEAISLDQQYTKAYYYLGLSQYELKNYKEAINIFKQGMEKSTEGKKIFIDKIAMAT